MWSRDGTSLLLPGVQVPLDGRPPQELPADGLTPGRWWGAVYSPDGSRVADVDNGSVVVADADAPDAQAPAGATEFSDAAWSPSGDRIAFIHDETVVLDGHSRTELRVTDVATGTERSLADASGPEWLEVIEFLPDDDRILFSRGGSRPGVSSLWSIKADGSDARRLVPRIEWADWRPESPTP